MTEIKVTLFDGSVCYVRIPVPNDIFQSEAANDEEVNFIANWLRMNMKNVKGWSIQSDSLPVEDDKPWEYDYQKLDNYVWYWASDKGDTPQFVSDFFKEIRTPLKSSKRIGFPRPVIAENAEPITLEEARRCRKLCSDFYKRLICTRDNPYACLQMRVVKDLEYLFSEDEERLLSQLL